MKYKLNFFQAGIAMFILFFPLQNFAQLQSTWTKCLYYDTGGMSPYHYDSLGVGPSGFAVRDDGKFYVMNMDYEQGYQSIYLLDTSGNQIRSFQGIGTYATLQEWDCFGLVATPGNSCAYIEHYFDFGGSPPPTLTYKLMHINSSGSIQTIHTWNYPDVLSRIIPNYHNSYYCKINGEYVDLSTGIIYPDSLIGLGPFINDEFIYSNQQTISRKDINGIVNWTIPANGYSAVALTERVVYIMGDSLKKIDATTGTELWTKEIPALGNPAILAFTDGLLFINGRDLTVVDSSGTIKGQNTINLTIDPPAIYSELSDGSVVGGGTFYSWSRYYRTYNRSGLVFKLNEEGHGIIDSTSFYHNGDADLDGVLTFYDDAVIIAAKLNETNSTVNLNFWYDYGLLVYSADWAQSFESGLNLKYSDNNLDNVIDTNDFHLLTSYSPLTGMWQYPHEDSTGIPLYCAFADSAGFDDDTITYYIIIGNVGEPIDSVYGISLMSGIRGYVSYTSYDLQFNNGVLGDTATDLFTYSNSPYPPILKSYVACRTDHQNITLAGGDTLATVKCVLNSNSVPGAYPAYISAHIIGKEGYSIPFHPVSDTLNLIITSMQENNYEYKINVYPNPVKNELHIIAEKQIDHIRITDVVGRVIYSEGVHDEQIIIDTTNFEVGVYFIRCEIAGAIKVVKLVVDN